MEAIIGDLVTLVGGGLIPAACSLRNKKKEREKEKGDEKKSNFSVPVSEVRAKNKILNQKIRPFPIGFVVAAGS